MRRHRLTTKLTSALVLASTMGLLPTAQADAAPRRPVVKAQQAYEVEARQFLDDLNGMRAEQGLQPVRLATDSAVQAVTQRLVDGQKGMDLRHSTTYMADLAAVGCQGSGEVLAGRFESGHTAIFDGHTAASMWRDSPPHYKVLMQPNLTMVAFAMKRETSFDDFFKQDITTTTFGANTIVSCAESAPAPTPTTTPSPEPTPKKLVVKRGTRVVRH